MIISHSKRYIFFAVPRTGTHTVRAALFPALEPDDWEQQSLSRSVRLPVPTLAATGHGHISYQQLLKECPDLCHDYFKFAFVRNPYERFVSVCAFLTRQNPMQEGDLQDFMKAALTRERFLARILVRPQQELLVDTDGNIAMDQLGRFERMQEDYDRICQQAGLPQSDLSHANGSDHQHFGRYYDQALLDAVTRFYEADFQTLGFPVVSRCEDLS